MTETTKQPPKRSDRDHLHPHRPLIELSTRLVITTSLVFLIFVLFVILTGLDALVPGLIPAIRVFGMSFAMVTSIWLLVSIWIIERRGKKLTGEEGDE